MAATGGPASGLTGPDTVGLRLLHLDVAVHDTIAVLRKREAGSGKREEGGVPCMVSGNKT